MLEAIRLFGKTNIKGKAKTESEARIRLQEIISEQIYSQAQCFESQIGRNNKRKNDIY